MFPILLFGNDFDCCDVDCKNVACIYSKVLRTKYNNLKYAFRWQRRWKEKAGMRCLANFAHLAFATFQKMMYLCTFTWAWHVQRWGGLKERIMKNNGWSKQYDPGTICFNCGQVRSAQMCKCAMSSHVATEMDFPICNTNSKYKQRYTCHHRKGTLPLPAHFRKRKGKGGKRAKTQACSSKASLRVLATAKLKR